MNVWQYLIWFLGSNARKTGPTAQPGSYIRPAALVEGVVFDDFIGPSGATPDPALWTAVDGEPRGISTCVAQNAVLDGNGNLALTATKQPDGTWNAALIFTTQPLNYGTYAARIKMSGGHGLHQSFWTLGTGYNFLDYPSGTPWPACGEMDIMECIADGKYYSTVHGPMYGGAPYNQSQLSGMLGFTPRLDYHVYWANKQPGHITFGIDNTTLGAIGRQSIPGGAPWELDQPQQAILSITVNDSSSWGGGTDSTTPDVATMLIDWFSYTPA